MARMLGVSPTYLSKVERDEFSPPSEARVKAIAKIIVRCRRPAGPGGAGVDRTLRYHQAPPRRSCSAAAHDQRPDLGRDHAPGSAGERQS
ncbi:MAG: helix-turn-helix transcriptional regulator [Sinobacteraceae bacterium]|nr:helix-turn-helix transcriptional regulator [Nevskiaceae bacterium]